MMLLDSVLIMKLLTTHLYHMVELMISYVKYNLNSHDDYVYLDKLIRINFACASSYTNLFELVAVCTYRLVMISIERSETAQKVYWKSKTNSVQDKMQSENFFLMVGKRIVFGLNFVSD